MKFYIDKFSFNHKKIVSILSVNYSLIFISILPFLYIFNSDLSKLIYVLTISGMIYNLISKHN